jgi:cation transport regulator ChaC
MNPASAARTLGRMPSKEELIPARLEGWQRKWQLHIDGCYGENGDVCTVVFLDITPAENGRSMNGILLPVSDEELERLDQRERHYNRTDVTHLISPGVDGVVYTYIGKDDCNRPPEGSFVMAYYEQVVADALELWGTEFAGEYHETTIPHEFQLHHGEYRWKPTS